jgi:formimidoylglutamate deiminase
VRLPGFVNAHSHAFQRALRGRAEGGDFWAWRELMLDEAERQTPELVRERYALAYREMLAAGYVAVGEFHYLGPETARAAAAAADNAGIVFVLLYAAYARGGRERLRQASVAEYLEQVEALREERARIGVAPHSVRACPAGWLEEIGRYAERERLVLHVHADEQPREMEECLAEHGVRPIELLARTGCLGPRTTVVHATHATDAELDLLADFGARVCLSPTTEANLGDGFAPVERLLERGIGLCFGSDSNVRIDPLEELREADGIARRRAGRRNVVSAETLLCYGSDEGAAALGLDEPPREIGVDVEHPSLRGVDEGDLHAALVFGCSADVVRPQSLHEWVDHTSELELHIEAETPELVFHEGLRALAELLGTATGKRQTRNIRVSASGRDRLLWQWLDELVFLSETEGFMPESAELTLAEGGLDADVAGRLGEPSTLVKAVTYHGLAFEEANGRYRARVVLDV